MPLTPFHWGPVLLLGYFAYRYLDFPTLMVAAVAVDFRTILVFFGLLDGPLHGFFHTFLGATVIAVAVALLIGVFREHIGVLMDIMGLPDQDYGWKSIFAASLIGAYSHVFFSSNVFHWLKRVSLRVKDKYSLAF